MEAYNTIIWFRRVWNSYPTQAKGISFGRIDYEDKFLDKDLQTLKRLCGR